LLTDKELQVLELISEGKAQTEIAAILSVSPAAVTHFKQSALRKIAASRETIKKVEELGFTENGAAPRSRTRGELR
jgi:DNA-binding CsgD family transcriptional regulator